jgi:hypothetical protein
MIPLHYFCFIMGIAMLIGVPLWLSMGQLTYAVCCLITCPIWFYLWWAGRPSRYQ